MTKGNDKCGPTTGGTPVTIQGGPWDEETIMFTTVMFGELAATKVDVGPEREPCDGYTIYKSIIATSPPHKEGPVPITVITPGKKPVKRDDFTYTFRVSDVRPSHAVVPKEGDPVLVIIRGDDLADVSKVEFGETPAKFVKIDPTQIWAVVPPREKAETVIVHVTTPRGRNKEKPSFTYDAC